MKIGIEGPSFAGKTTLCEELAQQFPWRYSVISEYVSYAGGETRFPVFPPKTREEAFAAFQFFILIEEQRQKDAASKSTDRVIFDRSIFTLAAFEYAVSPRTGINILSEIEALVENRREWWPHVIVILELSPAEITRRAIGMGSTQSPLFLEEDFNIRFGHYLNRISSRFGANVHVISAEGNARQTQEALLRVLDP